MARGERKERVDRIGQRKGSMIVDDWLTMASQQSVSHPCDVSTTRHDDDTA